MDLDIINYEYKRLKEDTTIQPHKSKQKRVVSRDTKIHTDSSGIYTQLSLYRMVWSNPNPK